MNVHDLLKVDQFRERKRNQQEYLLKQLRGGLGAPPVHVRVVQIRLNGDPNAGVWKLEAHVRKISLAASGVRDGEARLHTV